MGSHTEHRASASLLQNILTRRYVLDNPVRSRCSDMGPVGTCITATWRFLRHSMGSQSSRIVGRLALTAAIALLYSHYGASAWAGWNPSEQVIDFGVSISDGERHLIVEGDASGTKIGADLFWQVESRTCRLQALVDSTGHGTAVWTDVHDDGSFQGRPSHAWVSSAEALAVVAAQGTECMIGRKPGEFISVSSTPRPAGAGGSAAVESRIGAVVLVFRATAFYMPREVQVRAGEKVVWLYADGSKEPHTVSSGACRGLDCPGSGLAFASGPTLLKPGDRFEHTFTHPGSYPYHCDFHTANMQGTVIVRP